MDYFLVRRVTDEQSVGRVATGHTSYCLGGRVTLGSAYFILTGTRLDYSAWVTRVKKDTYLSIKRGRS